MSKNLLFCNSEENKKVIWNPHSDPDQHQNLITSRGSCLPSLVYVRFHVRQLSYLQSDRKNDNDHITSASSAEVPVINNEH